MHLSEFKAWFEGFTDGMDGIPSPKQWNKIKERVSQITNDYTPAPIFVDRYVRPYYPHAPYWTYFTTNLSAQSQTFAANLQSNNAAAAPDPSAYKQYVTCNVTQEDWRALGAADFSSVQ